MSSNDRPPNRSVKIIKPAPPPPEMSEREALVSAAKDLEAGLTLGHGIAKRVFGGDVPPNIAFEILDRIKDEADALMGTDDEEEPDLEDEEDE